jgi:hypothetical protein
MANPIIKIKRSAVAGKIPTTTSLELGELAINTYDGKIFIQQDQSSVGIASTVITINPWSVGIGSTAYNIYFTAGSVGIGITNPTSKLHIVGDTLVSGIVTASSFNGYQTLIGATSSATKTFIVTVASKTTNHRYYGSGSGSAYFIDGSESPFITLLPGKTYRFNQEDNSNSSHPLRFYFQSDKTTQYSTNVTTNGTAGSAGAYTEIIITDTTPIVLHYQCSAHGYMGNAVSVNSNFIDTPHQITARNGINVTGIVTSTSFSGNLSGNVTGTATTATNLADAANITTGIINSARLSGTYNIDVNYASNAGIATVAQGLTGTPNIVIGVVTATSFIKSGGTSSQFLKADGSVDTNTYLTSYTETDTLNSVTGRGNSTANGISVGVLTATSGNFSGILTSSGANISGVLTATSFVGSGSLLTGIVTSLTAGSGISLNQSTGNVTITATGGGGGSSQFVTTAAGIHTLSNVGIGTTNPTSTLTVTGNAKFTGIVTASSFFGDGSGLTGVTASGVVSVQISESAPASPSAGTLWYNSGLGRLFIYYNDGDSSQWVDAAPFNNGGGDGAVTISTLAPSSPTAGTLWYNSNSGRLFIYYDDGDSSQWVDAAPFNTTTPSAVDFPTGDYGDFSTTNIDAFGQNIGDISYDCLSYPSASLSTYDLGSV